MQINPNYYNTKIQLKRTISDQIEKNSELETLKLYREVQKQEI